VDDQILDPEQGDELPFDGDVACAAFPVASCADSSQPLVNAADGPPHAD